MFTIIIPYEEIGKADGVVFLLLQPRDEIYPLHILTLFCFSQVDWRNDPGPTGEGADASNRATTIAEVYQWLAEPGWGVPTKK